jgi:hypothetical protein
MSEGRMRRDDEHKTHVRHKQNDSQRRCDEGCVNDEKVADMNCAIDVRADTSRNRRIKIPRNEVLIIWYVSCATS